MDEKFGSNIVAVGELNCLIAFCLNVIISLFIVFDFHSGVDLSEFYMSVEWDILEVPAVR